MILNKHKMIKVDKKVLQKFRTLINLL